MANDFRFEPFQEAGRALGESFQRMTSLDPQEQSVGEMGGEMAAGFNPVLGMALAGRDIERARRAGDPVGMGLAATGLVPWGKVLGPLLKKGEGKAKSLKEILARISGQPGGDARHILTPAGVSPGQTNAAEAMLRNKASLNDIWKKMGLTPMENKYGEREWVREITPKDMRFKSAQLPSEPTPLEKVISHPELEQAYPGGTGLSISFKRSKDRRMRGSFDPDTGVININPVHIKSSKDLLEVLEHELTHGIAKKHGLPQGSSPDIEKLGINPEFANKNPIVTTMRESATRMQEKAKDFIDDPVAHAEYTKAADDMFEMSTNMRKKLIKEESERRYSAQFGEFAAEDAAFRSSKSPEYLQSTRPLTYKLEPEGGFLYRFDE